MSKVLIIEDETPYRKIYKRKFEVSGYEVEVAANGVEGLEKVKTFRPDIIFVDLMMPQMDGFQVLDHLKADPAFSQIPVVVLTNLSTADDVQKVMQKGAVGVLVKSDTEPNVIVAKAGEILSGKKAKAED